MKYSSHKKWLSSLSSTTPYNEGPVQGETRGIVSWQHTHICSPKDTLGAEEPLNNNQSCRFASILLHLVDLGSFEYEKYWWNAFQ